MRRKADAALFQSLGQSARIAFAAFQPVRDQNHRRRLIGVRQRRCGLFHGIGQRRLARWRDTVDPLKNGLTRRLTRFHQDFDVAAIATRAVTISHQTHAAIIHPIPQQVLHQVPRDHDLRGSFDLAPHRVRAVKNDHDVFICERRSASGKGHGQNGTWDKGSTHQMAPATK